LRELLSKNEDADMAEVIMNLKMEENVYRASLAGGAKIIQPSLVDFLR
jgi:flagellar hook-associated protein 3 FlgL